MDPGQIPPRSADDLVTGAVLPAVTPSLIYSGAVKIRLAQLPIHLIVQTAQPLAEGDPSACVWLVPAYPL